MMKPIVNTATHEAAKAEIPESVLSEDLVISEELVIEELPAFDVALMQMCGDRELGR